MINNGLLRPFIIAHPIRLPPIRRTLERRRFVMVYFIWIVFKLNRHWAHAQLSLQNPFHGRGFASGSSRFKLFARHRSDETRQAHDIKIEPYAERAAITVV